MKPYGVPRNKDVESPDVGDIHEYGLKSSIGGKDYHKGKRKSKAASRRIWKKKARRDGKGEINETS